MKLTVPVMLTILAIVLVCASNAQAQRYFADHRYLPPPSPPQDESETDDDSTEKSLRGGRSALPKAQIAAMLDLSAPTWVSSVYAPASPVLEQKIAEVPAHHVALGLDVGLEAAALFGDPKPHDGAWLFLATVVSTGAHALRLNVDLSALRADEQLWVLDADGRAAFGPFHAQDDLPETGLWLPTTLGEAVVLVLQSPRETMPLMAVNALSHFHRPLPTATKQNNGPLPCNIPIDQESDPIVREISTGVSIILIPIGNAQAACTATLLNSPDHTDNLPIPYLLSAWHCFGSSARFDGVEAFWDYRKAAGDDTIPDLYELPRNAGASLVAHNAVLDAALVQLASAVEIGAHGRAWVGWDSQEPATGDNVQCIHHPMAAHMMTSRGAITKTGAEVCMNITCSAQYEQQIEATWREGVTEPGSSGSALLNLSNHYRITGALSNGNAHRCSSDANNYDNFASFARFFTQIGCRLSPDAACGDPYEAEGRRCCLMRMLRLKEETLMHLRRFRDVTLGESDLGKQLVDDYYALSPTFIAWVEADIVARILAETAATLAAAWGAAL